MALQSALGLRRSAGFLLKPLVSIITPTFGREEFLAQALRSVREQTYPNIQWLILDDSPEPCRTLAACGDARILYEHVPQRLTIGEKRNRLIAKARGEYIAHFDDDDYYAPRFLEVMVSTLDESGADFANLSAWYLYDLRHDFFGFWNLRQTTGLHYICSLDRLQLATFTSENNATLRDNHLGYGFSYVYRRSLAKAVPFAARNWGEDAEFVKAAAANFKLHSIEDHGGLVLHVLHAASSSSCFPQYHLPNFLVPVLFAPYREFLWQQRQRRGPVTV
jgi:glycosyltransferase involved in cell wall biosynthesis